MTFTVASTSLTTPTWAEFSRPLYSVGSLSNMAACLKEVESKLNRGTIGSTSKPTDSEVYRWLQRAKMELAETRNYSWKRRYVTTTLTANTYRYSLPADFAGGHINVRDKTNDNKISITSPHQFDILYPDPAEETSGGDILLACIKGHEIWFMPMPGADEIELEYERTGHDLEDALTVTAITKASPGVVSVTGHGLAIDDVVFFSGLTEMYNLNNTYQKVTVIDSANTFSINDCSGYAAAESTGGACVQKVSDLSWLPEIERYRCCDFAIAEAFTSLHMWDHAGQYYQKWMVEVQKASRADGKRKWSTMGYRARSVFQA